MAWRRDGFERPAVAGDDLAVGQRAVGSEIGVVAGVETRRLAHIERAGGAVRAFRQHRRAGCRLDAGCRRRMVAMGVRDEDMRHRLAAHRVEQRRDMRLIERTGIDDRDPPAPDDIGHRAFEGERARVVAQDAAHAGRYLVHLVRCEVEAPVEGNVVAHR